MTRTVRLALVIIPLCASACSSGLQQVSIHGNAGDQPTAYAEFRTGPNYPLFAVHRDGHTYIGTAVQAKNAQYYYCIERNGAPWKIVEMPSFSYETVPYEYRGSVSSRSVIAPFSPAERLEQALRSPHRIPEVLNELDSSRGNRREGNWGVVPAFIITLPLEMATAGPREEQRLRRQRQTERFALARVQLGMTPGEVDVVYGEPRIVAREDDQHVRVYGEPSGWSAPQGPDFPHAHVAVYFDDGRASAMYTNDFLHMGYLSTLRR